MSRSRRSAAELVAASEAAQSPAPSADLYVQALNRLKAENATRSEGDRLSGTELRRLAKAEAAQAAAGTSPSTEEPVQTPDQTPADNQQTSVSTTPAETTQEVASMSQPVNTSAAQTPEFTPEFVAQLRQLLAITNGTLQPAAPAAPAAAPAPAPAPAAEPTMTIQQFAALHPDVMDDLKAAVLGSVMVAGSGGWKAFRIAVLGR